MLIARLNSLVGVILTVFIFALSARAEAQVWQVELEDRAEDALGKQLVLSVREKIKRSASLNLATGDVPRMAIIITTDMLKIENRSSDGTIYSVVWVWRSSRNSLYLDGVVDSARTADLNRSAERIVGVTEIMLRKLTKELLGR